MDEVSLIREKIDIVALIAEFVPLKKMGRNFKAPCPFHTEKSPSFVVSPERQIWHCFGCGKGGDVYTFLMEYERLEFPEALRHLAKRAGVELTNRGHTNTAQTSQKERLYAANSFAKEFYHYVLTKHAAGEAARAYLHKRGITEALIQTFQLGFSPNSGRALTQYLVGKKNFSAEEVVAAGLSFLRGPKPQDFFRGRLMFPLIDHRDNVVGFSGRLIAGDESTSKYINTRETLIYHKGEHFYGISVTKDAIRKANQAIIVEGEFDVISCFAHGISNVVAVKGTALTEQHVNLLGRFAAKITFCFDGDKAGQEAIKRSLVLVEKKDITPTVIEIPGGKDPDDALKSEPGLFKKAVKEEKGVYDYLLERTFAAFDAETAEGKQQISSALLPFFAVIKNEIIKEHYLRKLSSQLETSYESIQKELSRLSKPEPVKAAVPAEQKEKKSKEEVLEEYLFALIIQNDAPKHHAHVAVTVLSEVFSQERAFQKLLLHLSSYPDEGPFTLKQFASSLPHELVASFDTSLLYPLAHFVDAKHLEREVTEVAQKLKHLYVQKQLKVLAAAIKKEEEGENEAALEALKQSYADLAKHLETL